MILTRLDILDGWDPIKVCVAYEVDGRRIDKFPVDAVQLGRCKPVYEAVPGWTESTAGITNRDQLPANARGYIRRLEELLGIPAAVISTGPLRRETLVLSDIIPA